MTIWTAELELSNGDVVQANLWPNQTNEPGVMHFDPICFRIPKMKKRKQPVFGKAVWVVLNGKRIGTTSVSPRLESLPLYPGDDLTINQIRISVVAA